MHGPTLVPVERTERRPRREQVVDAGTGRAGGRAVGYGDFLWMAEGLLVVATFGVWVEVERLDSLGGRGSFVGGLGGWGEWRVGSGHCYGGVGLGCGWRWFFVQSAGDCWM